jgi:hypothetical protein
MTSSSRVVFATVDPVAEPVTDDARVVVTNRLRTPFGKSISETIARQRAAEEEALLFLGSVGAQRFKDIEVVLWDLPD